MKDLERELIKEFGARIAPDIEKILDKVAAVIAAHIFGGTEGDNLLCQLNRILEEIINN